MLLQRTCCGGASAFRALLLPRAKGISVATMSSAPATDKPRYKLTYFGKGEIKYRGRGEISRLILASAKVPYEAVTIQYDEWPNVKPTLNGISYYWGGLPLLEVDGETFGNGLAIASFLAKEHGLYGSNSLDQLRIDSIALAREDLLTQCTKWLTLQDEEEKGKLMIYLAQEMVPFFFGRWVRLLEENPSKSGWMVGDKLSLADLVVYEGTESLISFYPEVIEPYPELIALRERIGNSDGIKQYLAIRKPSPF